MGFLALTLVRPPSVDFQHFGVSLPLYTPICTKTEIAFCAPVSLPINPQLHTADIQTSRQKEEQCY